MDKTKIMIVEDEGIVARDIRNMVIGLGYDATNVTSTADEAIKIAESERPHLVLMDIMLSGKTTGVEAAVDEISENRGKLYDPDVVDACLEIFE